VVLTVEEVELAYDGEPALAGLSLEVGDGEIVALLGPSGCGKTSLLRVVAGLSAPDAGRVVLDGRDLAQVPTHQRGIGLMFQDYALFPHRDVAANVAFGLRMRGDRPPARQARVAEVLALVGLSGFGERAVGTLSGGERQRVALARALAPSPALLMLDEPLGALDRTLRDRLVLELSELFAELSIGVMYVTHDQAEALALADRVVVMDRGRVVQEGPPEQVWATPADTFVARFLGLSNVFPARWLDGGNDQADLGWIVLEVAAPVGADGRSGQVLIRPEAVDVAMSPQPNAVAATVEAVAFRGDHTQIWLSLLSGERLEARRPGADRPAVGARVSVAIDPAGVRPIS
jgi:thiamine transport system ATP-binding protein